jgi:ech hydrogenase subunit E
MGKRSIVPFGPQHPVLPEPVHLDLVLEDEKVVDVIPEIGFIHRGLEHLVNKRDFKDYVYVAERVCGICSFMHGMGYCESVEHGMGIEIPNRANYLRTIWAEMSRVHSHLLWLGLLADGFGFEALFNECWRIREDVLDMLEASTGGRCIFSVNNIGGVVKDMDSAMLHGFVEKFDKIERDLHDVVDTFLNDYTVKSRLVGVGLLTKEAALELGAVGPMMRASGWEIDMRKTGYSAYKDLEVKVSTSTGCDCYARTEVRIQEIFTAIDLIRQAVDKIPEGNIIVPVKGNPTGEYLIRLEQPRGEAVYFTKGNGTQYLDRFRLRTPTFANIPAMAEIMKGCDIADVPMIILTIDPCVSCTER